MEAIEETCLVSDPSPEASEVNANPPSVETDKEVLCIRCFSFKFIIFQPYYIKTLRVIYSSFFDHFLLKLMIGELNPYFSNRVNLRELKKMIEMNSRTNQL